MSELSTQDLIRQEVENLINETKNSLSEVKKFAISEVWKILQLLTAVVIQLIENLGNNLSSPEKKELALELIGSFYDNIFKVVDIPWVPSIVEPIIHSHVKSFLMLLVSSGIDAMVATFRQVGVFKPKAPVSVQANVTTERKIHTDRDHAEYSDLQIGHALFDDGRVATQERVGSRYGQVQNSAQRQTDYQCQEQSAIQWYSGFVKPVFSQSPCRQGLDTC